MNQLYLETDPIERAAESKQLAAQAVADYYKSRAVPTKPGDPEDVEPESSSR